MEEENEECKAETPIQIKVGLVIGALMCVVVAGALAYFKVDGWGWFVFAGLFLGYGSTQ